MGSKENRGKCIACYMLAASGILFYSAGTRYNKMRLQNY